MSKAQFWGIGPPYQEGRNIVSQAASPLWPKVHTHLTAVGINAVMPYAWSFVDFRYGINRGWQSRAIVNLFYKSSRVIAESTISCVGRVHLGAPMDRFLALPTTYS